MIQYKILDIIICTYNRADLLDSSLKSLELNKTEKDSFNIIVVDNNSIDNTKSVVESYVGRLNIKYIFEEKQGLSYARNRGASESNSSYVAFLDDDILIDVNWLNMVLNVCREKKYDIFGGKIIPFYKEEKPVWFKDQYATYEPANSSRELNKDEFLPGSNMIFKRAVFKKIGYFDELIGMKGGKVALGEDTKIQVIAEKSGIKRRYFNNLVIYHYSPINKMNIAYITKRAVNSYMVFSDVFGREYGIFSVILKTIIDIIKTFTLLLTFPFKRNVYKYWQNFYIEKLLHKMRWAVELVVIIRKYEK